MLVFCMHNNNHLQVVLTEPMDDLISVMGAGRLVKVARKNRRNRNQKIREGKVELNEKGEWVPKA